MGWVPEQGSKQGRAQGQNVRADRACLATAGSTLGCPKPHKDWPETLRPPTKQTHALNLKHGGRTLLAAMPVLPCWEGSSLSIVGPAAWMNRHEILQKGSKVPKFALYMASIRNLKNDFGNMLCFWVRGLSELGCGQSTWIRD